MLRLGVMQGPGVAKAIGQVVDGRLRRQAAQIDETLFLLILMPLWMFDS
jgi:hypothetical protein